MKTAEEKVKLIESIFLAFDSEELETQEQVIDYIRAVIENREITLPSEFVSGG